MKIFMLINSLEVGGGERVMLELARSLRQHHEVYIFILKDVVEYNTDMEIFALDQRPILPLQLNGLARKFRKVIQEHKPDVVLSFLELSNFVNIIACRGTSAKPIISVRSVLNEVYKSGAYGKYFNYMIKKLYPQAHTIVANSKYSALSLATNYGIPARKIKYIYNPVNVDEIQRLSREALKPEHKKIFKKDVLLHVGRLIPVKNQERIIRAFSRANTDANLVIIGDGPLRKHLDIVVERMSLTHRVFLLGSQGNPFKFMARAKAFVLASSYEGFPNALAEALACKLPVISADCRSGPREILSPETPIIRRAKKMIASQYGMLVPPMDRYGADKQLEFAITKLLSDKALQRKYSQKAAVRARDFDISIISKRFEEVLHAK